MPDPRARPEGSITVDKVIKQIEPLTTLVKSEMGNYALVYSHLQNYYSQTQAHSAPCYADSDDVLLLCFVFCFFYIL